VKLEDFDFDLPDGSIARYPTERRDGARLLVLRRSQAAHGRSEAQAVEHRRFTDLPALLRPGDLVVVNDTKVLWARFVTRKRETGGKVEVLLIAPIEGRRWRAMLNGAKALRPGQALDLEPGVEIVVRERPVEGFADVELPMDAEALAARYGDVPLPPYLSRDAEASDRERYQTIFARAGAERSVAAPTAGLHFTRGVLAELARRGVEHTRLTLHVGPGTFLPVRAERIEEHRMHAERYEVPAAAAEAIVRARTAGGRIVAVGTTVTRVLETVSPLRASSGSTELFIRPGHAFANVDALLTNFHLPKSTLLMLVSAFAGHDATMAAYREAIAEGYRFFSYGDAMLIL
jgi:S-adenosylmethionine:tRNA ribosyltransferase-isomerase